MTVRWNDNGEMMNYRVGSGNRTTSNGRVVYPKHDLLMFEEDVAHLHSQVVQKANVDGSGDVEMGG